MGPQFLNSAIKSGVTAFKTKITYTAIRPYEEDYITKFYMKSHLRTLGSYFFALKIRKKL